MEKKIGNVKGNSVEAWGYTDSAMQGSNALPIYLGLGLLIAKVIIGYLKKTSDIYGSSFSLHIAWTPKARRMILCLSMLWNVTHNFSYFRGPERV